MKEEIGEGVNFLRQFLAKYGQLSVTQIAEFGYRLTGILEKRYENHWYESNPMKGQAFRCLRLKRSESYVDPTIESILNEMGLSLSQLGLPDDFTLWIDPGEVSVRFGDSVGYTYTIAKLEKSAEREAPDQQTKLIVQNSDKIFSDTLTAFIRQNSSNHDFADLSFSFNDLNVDTGSSLPIEKRTISPPLSKTANSSTMPIHSRLSGTDTSYFSSSSSSCASSFGSEHNNFGWFSNSDLFPSHIDQEQSNLNLLNFDFMKSALGHSDASSERSDTPNSSITNSSYFGNFSFAFDGIFASDAGLDSSGSSTSTTVFTQTEKDDVQTPKKVSDSEEEKAKMSPKSNKKAESKRDSSYCGYVESFPYYYKLNRLYNALALQKMQTERLKKAGLLNQSNINNPVAVAQAFAAFQSINIPGTSPTGGQMAARSPPRSKYRGAKNNKRHSQPMQQAQQSKNL